MSKATDCEGNMADRENPEQTHHEKGISSVWPLEPKWPAMTLIYVHQKSCAFLSQQSWIESNC